MLLVNRSSGINFRRSCVCFLRSIMPCLCTVDPLRSLYHKLIKDVKTLNLMGAILNGFTASSLTHWLGTALCTLKQCLHIHQRAILTPGFCITPRHASMIILSPPSIMVPTNWSRVTPTIRYSACKIQSCYSCDDNINRYFLFFMVFRTLPFRPVALPCIQLLSVMYL